MMIKEEEKLLTNLNMNKKTNEQPKVYDEQGYMQNEGN